MNSDLLNSEGKRTRLELLNVPVCAPGPLFMYIFFQFVVFSFLLFFISVFMFLHAPERDRQADRQTGQADRQTDSGMEGRERERARARARSTSGKKTRGLL